MLKSESHGADFSFDRIGLIPSICRHQSSIQDLLAFLQPFNVLSYRAIHKVAPHKRSNLNIETKFYREPSLPHPRSCVESYADLGTREAVFLRRRTAGLRHSN
jgi:hypothetical protein